MAAIKRNPNFLFLMLFTLCAVGSLYYYAHAADYTKGATAASSPIGTPILAVRQDSPTVDSGTNQTQQRLQTDSTGALRVSTEGGHATYRATSQFACDSTATDIWLMQGVSTNTIKIQWIRISTTATSAAVGDVTIIRRTANDTAGTTAAATLGLLDGRDAAPAAAPVHYTAHPTSLGAAATNPNVACARLLQGTAAVTYPVYIFDFRGQNGERGGLRVSGTSDFIVINAVAGLGATGNAWDIEVCWTEEPTTA